MQITDSIADMLTRIRNSRIQYEEGDCSNSS